jgi:hypothetical protein
VKGGRKKRCRDKGEKYMYKEEGRRDLGAKKVREVLEIRKRSVEEGGRDLSEVRKKKENRMCEEELDRQGGG